jgi:hypothetical protein
MPFSVRRTTDGRLVLADPATDRVVDLWAFGETNARAFARFLPDAPDTAAEAAKTREVAPASAGERTAALKQQESRQ